MTCKECFHYDICDSFAEHELREMMRANCKEKHWCVHFIDKNKVIEAPNIEQVEVQVRKDNGMFMTKNDYDQLFRQLYNLQTEAPCHNGICAGYQICPYGTNEGCAIDMVRDEAVRRCFESGY